MEDSIEFSPAKKHNMRAGLQLESFWVIEPRAPELQRDVHLREQPRVRRGAAEHVSPAHRFGPRRLHAMAGRGLRAGRLDDPKDVLAQPRPPLRAAVASRRHDGLRAPRRHDVDAREVHGARRLGHLQRLVRDEPLRADAARQRRHAAGRGRTEPGISRSVRRRLRHRAAGEHHPELGEPGDALDAPGIDRRRAELRRPSRADQLLHAARVRPVPRGERQRAGERRPSGAGRGQHHRAPSPPVRATPTAGC